MDRLTKKRVAQVGVGLATVALAGYLIQRAHGRYQTDLKIYEAAKAAVKPEDVVAWEYYVAVSQLRGKYIMDHISFRRTSTGLAASLRSDRSFPRFWLMTVEINPVRLSRLERFATAAGKTMEQARDHVRLGNYDRVKCPWPTAPVQWDYNWALPLQLPVVVCTGVMVEIFLRCQ